MRTGWPRISLLFAVGWLALLVPARLPAEPYTCRACSAPRFLDGRLNDWPEPYITLDRWCWRPAAGLTPVYGGLYDLSATLRLAWDDRYLYLGLAVVDDQFLPARDGPIDTGDAVIIRLAPAAQGEPAEFAFTLTGNTTVHARTAGGEWQPAAGAKIGAARMVLSLPGAPLPREAGKPDAKFITKLLYEAAIPWEDMPGITPAAGADFGLEVRIQDDDGEGIRGCLKWRGQAGEQRTPSGYGRVRLAAPAM